MEKVSDTGCHVIIDISSGNYLSPPQIGVKRGRPRLLKPEEEFFSYFNSYIMSPEIGICRNPPFPPVYCFSGNSRIVISWIIFMYLPFGVIISGLQEKKCQQNKS